MKTLIQTISFISYKAVEDSGDHKNSGNGGYRGVYKLYWENEYQFIFYSFFYTLSSDIRNDKLITKIAKDSFKIYTQFISNKEECKKSYLERKGPTERIKGLRVFDGKKMIKSNQITLNNLLHLMKENQMLMGWELGIPKHLSYRGELPVTCN